MKKVITYGSFDLMHYGHIRLLERAKKLGDYLIVGVTSDDYDKTRGKINLQQSLTERVEAVKATGLADQIVIEEYEGQKIDDIKKFRVDIFTVGSDWRGKFDYLNKYCDVVYLERTKGVSSSQIRSEEGKIRLGIVGDVERAMLQKIINECAIVNGIDISGIYTTRERKDAQNVQETDLEFFREYDGLLEESDAVYILSQPSKHYEHIKKAIGMGKHVLVELPMVLEMSQCDELFKYADENKVILMPALKTAYSTAYNRLVLIIQSGKIGKVLSVDATCTSIRDFDMTSDESWCGMYAWGPTTLLPIFQILGTDYVKADIYSSFLDNDKKFDSFSKIHFLYEGSLASAKVGAGVKSEGELIVSGTKGYVYVPAPWWKTEYFELRYEKIENNRKYFYQLDGEGIRYELVEFVKSIKFGKNSYFISNNLIKNISAISERFDKGDITELI